VTERPSAHNSDGSWPPRAINVDQTGVSMSWKTAIMIVAAVGMGAAAWTVFTSGLATKDQLVGHNLDSGAHPIVITSDQKGNPVALPTAQIVSGLSARVDEQVGAVESLSTKVDDTAKAVGQLADSVYEDRAERFADSIADKYRDARRSRTVWSDVKKKALSNLRSGKPLRDGLDDL